MAEQWNDRNRSDFRNDRGYPDRERHDRGMADRAGDEVRSWFGDDEAARRRRMDEQRDSRQDGDWGDQAARAGERAFERTRDTVRDVTDRDRDGRRGLAEFNDADRPWDRSRTPGWSGSSGRSYENSDYMTRQRSFGDPQRYANADPYPPSWNSYGAGQRPNYAGRGPRGYQRTDDRIREDICDCLTDDSRIDASDVDIQVSKGEVTLGGSVRSRDEKRLSEDIVERISGVREVNNNLKVRPADEVLGTARSGSSVLGLTDNPPPPAAKK